MRQDSWVVPEAKKAEYDDLDDNTTSSDEVPSGCFLATLNRWCYLTWAAANRNTAAWIRIDRRIAHRHLNILPDPETRVKLPKIGNDVVSTGVRQGALHTRSRPVTCDNLVDVRSLDNVVHQCKLCRGSER